MKTFLGLEQVITVKVLSKGSFIVEEFLVCLDHGMNFVVLQHQLHLELVRQVREVMLMKHLVVMEVQMLGHLNLTVELQGSLVVE